MTRRRVLEMVPGFGAFGLGARRSGAEDKVAGRPAKAFEVSMTDAEWQRRLTPAQFTTLRKHGTERAWSSPLDKEYGRGTYHCAGCELPLFSSDTKFDSRTPEVHCRRCGGHLGRVFDDGPKPTGLRYCMNGGALIFRRA